MYSKACLVLTSLLMICLTADIGFAYTRPKYPKKAVQSQKSETKSDTEKDYVEGSRADKVDKTIDQIESEVGSLADPYKSGKIWDKPEMPEDASKGRKAASYALLVPTYVFRAVTWPIAIAADGLIKKGVVRKIVNLVSNKDRTLWVYPTLELGFGSGFGGGIGFRNFDLWDKKYQLGGSYSIHVNLNQEAYLSFGTPELYKIWEKPISFKVRTDYINHNQNDFYGIGINAPESDKTKYGMDILKTGGWVGYEIIDNLSIRTNLFFEWNNSRTGKGGPSVESEFSPSTLTAYKRDLYYVNLGLALVHDDRNDEIVPDKGGLRRIYFERLQGLGTTKYDYNEYGLELYHFIPALMPRHTLVLRTQWIYQQQTGEGIPFYRLTKMDVNSPMRGFNYGRYTDRGSAVFNVEYRFPVWKFLDGQFFFDTGRVFHKPTDFSFKHFKYNGGAGLNFRTKEYFLMRFQVGYGGEGVRLLFKTSQAF